MLKKRLIFTLLYQKGGFYLSRNFRLQRVGGIDWLQNNYRFSSIAKSIDELIILNVSRSAEENLTEFASIVSSATSNCFMPLSLGGGIKTHADADFLISIGADKLVLNTALAHSQDLVKDLVSVYGSQCIVASVDYRLEHGLPKVYTHCGQQGIDSDFTSFMDQLESLRIGEIYMNSIDQDGTGQGFCMESLNFLNTSTPFPVILAGGAGNQFHLLDGLKSDMVDAVATANLFNFIGDGLPKARKYLIEQQIPLALW